MEINHNVEGLTLSCDPPMAQKELFFYSHDRLESRLNTELSRASSSLNTELIDDLRTALDFTQEQHGATFNDLNGLLKHGEITFDLLWALIPPNTLVYHFHELTEQHQILLARSISLKKDKERKVYAAVQCDFIHDNGIFFGLARTSIAIYEFHGARRIQDLPLFPIKYHPKQAEIQQSAILRGVKFAKMREHTYYEISGPAIRLKEWKDSQEGYKAFKFTSHGRVMIDATAFRNFEPNSPGLIYKVDALLDRESLTDEQYMICSPILLGFCFGAKLWGGFAIDRISNITWSEEPFRSLVLDPKQKMLVLSLVKQQSRRAKCFDDVVQGKGKGLIGLLSGRPGCGKTLTAEAVAEQLKQPLYSVGAGELGTTPEEVGQRLSRILELTQTWNAVLLFDEAEVFLQERTVNDMNRNALVSIFLRELEYYQGVLILTTNLIIHFDPAFESRIHFCIHYPDLNMESRRSIWRNFFNKANCNVNNEDLTQLALLNLNGRQIKNTVGSALSIALEEETSLTVKHINTVLDVVQSWEEAKTSATAQN